MPKYQKPQYHPASRNTSHQGNIRFVPPKEERHHYIAYSTFFIDAGPNKGWSAVPYTFNQDDKSYLPDESRKVRGKSRAEAVEKLFLKFFTMPEEGITHDRMQCIDWMENATA